MVVDTSFLPILLQSDVERTAQLIQQAYAPPTASNSLEDLKRLQTELFELQKRPEAWGLVIPLLEYPDQNVQFFGAHTAQVKIARDWEHFPPEHAGPLRDLMVQLTAHSMSIGRSKFILRKLFVALTSLALKLVPGHPTRWPEWIMGCTMAFSGAGAPAEYIHDFLAIVAEEAGNVDLIGSSKLQIQQSLKDAISMVVQVVRSSLESSQQIPSALKCFQSWMSIIPSSDITPLIPLLISLLTRAESDSESFEAASEAIQEIMTKSALSDGSGSRTLTEPLLLWIDSRGSKIIQTTLQSGNVDEISHSLCKLIVALGDHSTSYIAANLASPTPVVPTPQPPDTPALPTKTRGELSQSFLRLLLSYTGLPGHYGVDEEESEMTLAFWYLFQEALWSVNYYVEEEEEDSGSVPIDAGADVQAVARAVYSELVQILRRKVAFPGKGAGWSKDQVEKFQVYRRDVGDTLINAYYVLRHDMLGYLVEDAIQRLNVKQEQDGWQEIEATLHCITSIQEAIDMEKTPHLPRVFGPEILGRLPSTGANRIRRTTLGLIGAYSSWFASQPSMSSGLLMSVLTYVASALTDPTLCLQAAIALRNLCDANRKALAPEIGAFGQLHAALGSIPVSKVSTSCDDKKCNHLVQESEKSKVVQSIASVIQALPAHEEIEPITAIVDPIVRKLAEALQSSSSLPDEARTIIINELETLSGVAKGLTRSTDGLVILGERDSESQASLEAMERAKEDPRVVNLRKSISDTLGTVVNIWSTDAGISSALSDLFKSITCLPADTTLISLAPGPLLGLLNPPPSLVLGEALNVKTGPTPEAVAIIGAALPLLLECSLNAMSPPGAMEARSSVDTALAVDKERLIQHYGRRIMKAVLEGFASVAPRSVVPNLIEILGTLLSRAGGGLGGGGGAGGAVAASWIRGILFAVYLVDSIQVQEISLLTTSQDDFVASKATREVKEIFAIAIINSRSLKRTREAANQFTLVARGLESSGFGYASVCM
ncbi:hypothetical protein C0995_010614 [Termitomyces sp. Mi166|nr:hypothetical protein C0995_010614 [Termitomyces sp. Mi166\